MSILFLNQLKNFAGRNIFTATNRITKRMTSTNQSFDINNFYADANAPVVNLSAKDFFHQLTDAEQKYAHYISKAGHYGSRIVARQVSHESEAIVDLIVQIQKNLNSDYSKLSVSETSKKGYLEYASQILSNLGNYKSFGDKKFIPRVPAEDFEQIVKESSIDLGLFNKIKDSIYSINEKSALLGYPAEGHVSGYYIGDVSKDDVVLIKKVLSENQVLFENLRIKKNNDTEFTILVASKLTENKTSYPNEISADGIKINLQFGDYSKEFAKINENLEKAKEVAANETQVKMLDAYIESFETGSINAHKESQKYWVKDISPVIETNIGFIETYREPGGVAGEWETLVSIQNKEQTKKFQKLVDSAPQYIKLLPWGEEYEKDVFQAPDFTSLEVLTFAGSGIPAGINIPNYDDIRQNIGFKNVNLGNIVRARSGKQPITFLSPEDSELYNKYADQSFEVQVGIHELLGHGSGKLLSENQDGTFNYDHENPPLGVDGKPVTTYYKKGETWGSKFGSLAGAYEECRAEVIALYLITDPEILTTFGFKTKEEQRAIIYVGFLQMARAGFTALEQYDPASKKWGQAHSQARYAILKTLLQANLVELVYTKPENSDLYIKVDESKIETVGHQAVKDYLTHLHIYKASGDYENGSKYFIDRSSVHEEELGKFRKIVMDSRLPRKQFIQANTEIVDGKVVLKEYEESEVGLIQSFVERDY
ncbi:dipeptidyl-peptidase III [Wickerhamomyces ciferrii]|uniref:Dipeptidyl peptidase 3 n=1 Tax=Wickerhamomyces ciferrii (strain ATCC 14091 / BCRC 22168 / CBS 111 / JCM 3599 / NBRC 0793 / NRRL Y-1031 F-60-10) TaxID=1206466 RepID=K0KGY7_WICCF|nr:dipeptidyl-peptidase III [Wickerhamomyces ciferrii]CCH44455.1 dipeptidyl-peptidase III [Wickerhamomyces ciferrii]